MAEVVIKEIKKNKDDLSKFDNLINLVAKTDNVEEIKTKVKEHLQKIIKEKDLKELEIRFIFDSENEIRDYTADQIYNSISVNEPKPNKNILLLIHSKGGSIEPAYLISKCCKEFSKKFIVVVPRLAKSAATLISLGADEIHMGQMSQLGPIDPQIGGLPTLGLSNAVEYLASLCKKYPESSEMLAKYLSFKLDLRILGYFERVTESAVQYAQRLLENNKKLPKNMNPTKVAWALVYSYKDHSFVIDCKEAKKYLGETIKIDTPEYRMANELHKFLEDVQRMMRIFKKKELSLVGSIEHGLYFSELKEEN